MAQVHDPSKPPPDHWDEEMAASLVARPGEYRLSSTGEVVADPDFTAAWTVTPPDDA
jgi:hypothetical protein